MTTESPQPASEFDKVCRGRAHIDLPRLMLELATDADPTLDWADCQQEVERLCRTAAERLARLPADADTHVRLRALSDYFCEEEGFGGNEEDYYDPRNSYLHEVLARRTGIPITLCLLYAHVGRACGLPLEGVNAPAHFMVRCPAEGGDWFVDVFHAGDILNLRDCRRRIEQLLGMEDPLPPEALHPASIREITARLLRNLKALHVAVGDWRSALPVQKRLANLLPSVLCERRDLGLIALRAEQPHLALAHLAHYCDRCSAVEREELSPFLHDARRRVAEHN